MLSQKQAEEAMVSSFTDAGQRDRVEEEEKEQTDDSKFGLKNLLWHGGSAYDAWFSCASNQVDLILVPNNHFLGHVMTCAVILPQIEDLAFVHKSKSLINFDTTLTHSVFLAWDITQVAQVLLTLPYSFSQLGMLSGIVLQIFYGILGSWTAYLISVLYVEYRTRKEKENHSFKNHVIQVHLYSRTATHQTKSMFPHSSN